MKKMKITQLMRMFFLLLSKMLSNMIYALTLKNRNMYA
jgi:hypothetical protein